MYNIFEWIKGGNKMDWGITGLIDVIIILLAILMILIGYFKGFMNKALITKINVNLKLNNIMSYLEKFPQNLVCDVTKKTNKDLIDMTLEQIFEKKELYDEDDLSKYEHNLKVIKSKEVQQNSELKAILNKKYSELFEEYINSKEFKVDEINRLTDNEMSDIYIKRYIYLSKNFIKFFSN